MFAVIVTLKGILYTYKIFLYYVYSYCDVKKNTLHLQDISVSF